MNCLFCNIAQNEKERMTIYEDESLVLIMDKFPICDGHALVIPKKHFEDIYEVDEKTLSHRFEVAKKYAKVLMNVTNEKGCTFSINYGDKQEIKHLHLHIMPNYKGKPSKKVDEVYNLVVSYYEKEKKN